VYKRQALTGVRGQDTDVAGANAGLTADTNKTRFTEGGVNDRFGAELLARQRQADADRIAQTERNKYAADRGYAAQQDNRPPWWLAPVTQAVGTIGASAITASDERVKTDVHRDTPRDTDAFLSALQSHNYRYRDPADGTGERHGPMAQELEQSRIGRQFVTAGPDGTKYVQASPFELALAGAVAEKVRGLEERQDGGRASLGHALLARGSRPRSSRSGYDLDGMHVEPVQA
jgi:hypothetical protein